MTIASGQTILASDILGLQLNTGSLVAGALTLATINGSTVSVPNLLGGSIATGSIAAGGAAGTLQPLSLNPANFIVAGGTISTSGTLATINVTSSNGYQINGAVAMNISASLNAVSLGFGAGAVNVGGLNTFIGDHAGAANTSGGENTFVGQIAGYAITTGSYNTALGEHAMGTETTCTFSTAVGNDSQRNYISLGNNTSVGKNALYVGGGQNETAIGAFAKQGNGASIQLGGTPTTGDVCSLTFTGSFSGSPQTVSYTVQVSDTLANIATGLYTAIQANSTVYALIGNGSGSGVNDNSNIVLNWFAYACGAITLTFAATGASTETALIGNGSVGVNNVALGASAMYAAYHTTGAYNIAVGKNSLYWLTSGSNNTAIGQGAGNAITTGSFNTLIGNNAGLLITAASGALAIGQSALSSSTGPGYSVAVGHQALQNNALTTNPGLNQANVAIGANAM
jgi:hypothetical protein